METGQSARRDVNLGSHHKVWGSVEHSETSSESFQDPSERRRALAGVSFQPSSCSSESKQASEKDSSSLQRLAAKPEARGSRAEESASAAPDDDGVLGAAARGALAAMWSQGSQQHSTGRCKPCHYYHTNMGCLNGLDCTFCHLPHTSKGRLRPGKARREHCKQLASMLQQAAPTAAAVLSGEDGPQAEGSSGALTALMQVVGLKSPYMHNIMKSMSSSSGHPPPQEGSAQMSINISL